MCKYAGTPLTFLKNHKENKRNGSDIPVTCVIVQEQHCPVKRSIREENLKGLDIPVTYVIMQEQHCRI